MRKGIILVLFLILMPYFLVTFCRGTYAAREDQPLFYKESRQDSLYWVCISDKRGKSRIGLEEYLVGILGSTIEAGYELETLKAQAVLLRSSFYYEMKQHNNTELEEEKLGFSYQSEGYWRKVWGENFTAYYEKCQKAVQMTEGIVLLYEGKNIPGAFCSVSAGSTRESNVEEYGYFRKARCPNSMEYEKYLQVKSFPAGTFQELEVVETDQCGYVLSIMVNGTLLSAEEFRENYQLASTHLTIHPGKEYMIETRGVGHGWGMDQYYANYMILLGKKQDYMELISYFYQNISFEKTASYKN